MESNSTPKDPEDLRRRAEESLKSEADRPDNLSPGEATALIHELRVHQIELEMQNEELRRAQNDLEISRTHYADLYDFAPVGYLTLDKHGQIVNLNLTAATQLGVERRYLFNRHLLHFVSQPDKNEFLSHLNAVFKKRERQIVEVRLSPKDGEQFYARLESIYMEEDCVGVCRTNMSDVALRKKAEQVLQNAHDVLERSVTERTTELATANEALEGRRDELAHLDRVALMGELASSMAHELSQPLTSALTNAQAARRFLAMEKPDLDEVRAALDDIVEDHLRARAVIQNMRSLLKKQAPGRKAIDINTVVQETVKLIASEAVKKRISVETELASGLPQIMGNSVQLQQVLLNLILNGFHAMANHESDCRNMTIRTSGDTRGIVMVNVCDTGPGVDEETMGRIFERFFTTQPEGLGMGLPISRSIVEAHGGQLWAGRNPECGMTFYFSLPVGNVK
jgi:PAS domain S-box-containing protein